MKVTTCFLHWNPLSPSIVSNLAAIAAAIQGLTEAVGYVGVAIGAMCVILAFNACKR